MDIVLWNDDAGRVVAYTPPGGMTAEEARADAGLVPQDRPTFVHDSAALPHAQRLAAWRLSESGDVSIAEDMPPPRIVVGKGRVKLELLGRGLYDEVRAGAQVMGAAGEIFWNDFENWESDHGVVLAIAAGLSRPLDAAAVHALFAAARDRDV